jgi:hypothetical protein
LQAGPQCPILIVASEASANGKPSLKQEIAE